MFGPSCCNSGYISQRQYILTLTILYRSYMVVNDVLSQYILKSTV